ncbi:GNAT family N-acetyltransferase [Enterococcus sp. CWB-B31]|uniref:GNAT family N-acetyltransferase n=1 Tax=Enterococcus sp. CWB-B31 TaxID=2885159 RepID=UPI001E621506|nr:GNAT family N-acetyltransferase [Enterococcus sp. CWB-B31]MCB5954393.1 GNAT family N-acetyltransferase [Enterococcus sp. CWB-B31]
MINFIELLEETDWITGNKQGDISYICIAEEMEGRRFGKEMMNQAEKWAKDQGYQRISLKCFFQCLIMLPAFMRL